MDLLVILDKEGRNVPHLFNDLRTAMIVLESFHVRLFWNQEVPREVSRVLAIIIDKPLSGGSAFFPQGEGWIQTGWQSGRPTPQECEGNKYPVTLALFEKMLEKPCACRRQNGAP